jgi:hypothetical protein
MPRVMNVDRSPAYPAAVEALKADGAVNRRPFSSKVAVITVAFRRRRTFAIAIHTQGL